MLSNRQGPKDKACQHYDPVNSFRDLGALGYETVAKQKLDQKYNDVKSTKECSNNGKYQYSHDKNFQISEREDI